VDQGEALLVTNRNRAVAVMKRPLKWKILCADNIREGVPDGVVMDHSQSYRSASTSAAVVELGATMRTFYTRSIGAPDVLFTVLLSSAREAYAITEPSGQQPARDGRAQGLVAEIYLAGALLCDASFVPARVPPDCEHHYALDLVKQEIQLSTRVCGVTGGRISLFGVTLKGSILGNEFVLINTSTKSLLANVLEDVIKQPDFFRDELPRLACQPEPRQAEGPEEPYSLVDQAIELRVVIPLKDGPCELLVKKSKAAQRAQVCSGEKRSPIGSVGLGCLQRLIRAALNQANTPSPRLGDGNMNCFLQLLPVILQQKS
jgi:hypothetical protein